MSGLKMKSKTAKELKINLKEEVEKSLNMTKAHLPLEMGYCEKV